ncbi:MAG: ribosome biogenesis protein [Nanoarchaeota archaeon]|jgi:H/ACA ribonucleoprotein complex subunit 3|nr:ribosome biogenesis protein [Nanoarchaeota archaeon]
MTKNILRCSHCNLYTLEKTCPKCKKPTLEPKPAKFSVKDKFGKYRRNYKKQQAL